jgi:uroporphyrinogen-III synthase
VDRRNVWLVGAGPGDPELITVRGRELLSQADLVLYDSAVHPALLGHCKPDAEIVEVESFDRASSETAARLLAEAAGSGRFAVRLTTGDPLLFSARVQEAELFAHTGADDQPLFGRRIVVLRPAHQAHDAARGIRRRGAQPLICPAIVIEPPPDPTAVSQAARDLGSYQWVVFTSVNGVDKLFAELDAQGLDARAFGGARVAAIGPQTASALATRGLRADCVAREFVGEALGEALREAGHLGRVLLVRALEARDALPEMLRRAGAAVDVVPAYRTRPARGPEAAALARVFEIGHPDIVLLTATSTVTALLDALGARAAELLAKPLVASIGPITTRAAQQRGLHVHVTAERYTVEGLLDALEHYYRVRDPAGRPGG